MIELAMLILGCAALVVGMVLFVVAAHRQREFRLAKAEFEVQVETFRRQVDHVNLYRQARLGEWFLNGGLAQDVRNGKFWKRENLS